MLGHSPSPQVDADPAALIPWLKDIVLRPEDSLVTEVQVRLRGNILHVLCESNQAALSKNALSKDYVLMRLVRSLMEPEIKTWLQEDFPQIYQVYVYSRKAPDPKPVWSAPIYLNRLEKHLERLVQGAKDAKTVAHVAKRANLTANAKASVSELSPEPSPGPSSEQLADISLARQGDSGAIARYLSEALSALNVGVQVSARVVPGKARKAKAIVNSLEPRSAALATEPATEPATELATEPADEAETTISTESSGSELVSRLWVFCEASYSPDPLLIAEPIAERLRQLHLQQFQDAVITIQVTGEAASDWRLRVDLTPPEEMLREWARWGDVPAISMLANHSSRRYGLKLVAEFKKETLHLISYAISDTVKPAPASGTAYKTDIDELVNNVASLLQAIAPQGIHRAMIYGPSTDNISPEWLRGIDLPAAEDPALSESVIALASRGDMPALAYSLTRALNPDIKDQLATGGVRVQLLLKDRLLHIMADGPVCPPKNAIVPLVKQTLEPMNAADLTEGIRLYGRRAGQKQPIWTYGQDYQTRERMVPEAKPEFAASEAYIGGLITSVGEGSLVDAAEDSDTDIEFRAVILRALQFAMVKSQVFIPADDTNGLTSKTLPKAFRAEGGKMALIWGGVGLFLAIQFDFLVGQALQQAAAPVIKTAQASSPEGVQKIKPSPFNEELARLDWNASRSKGETWDEAQTDDFAGDDFTRDDFAEDDFSQGDASARASTQRRGQRFDNRDFTASAINDDELIYSPQQDFVSTSSLLAGSTLPTFHSQQLDEKLALYRRRVAQSGPPDVLVIGSSRALRGVDPAALRQALDASGYDGLSIFNFGVNGATAQVVDLIVRRLIPPDQLPQMIVWADGARAFNSGRVDVTFNAIATSEGYRQLQASDTPDGMNDLALGSLSDQLKVIARTADRGLSEFFGQVSSGYSHRARIRTALGQGFGAIAPDFAGTDGSTQVGDTPTGAPTETSLIDYDGFLALSTRFNPATYYQEHAEVKGLYDGDYKDFQLEGKQAEATRNLLTFTSSKDVPVIFINTPLTDEYLDSYRSEAEETFSQYMVEISQSAGDILTYRDFGQLWPQRYDYFSDPSHLNRYGAYQVSSRLAQDPLISWPEPLPLAETAEQ